MSFLLKPTAHYIDMHNDSPGVRPVISSQMSIQTADKSGIQEIEMHWLMIIKVFNLKGGWSTSDYFLIIGMAHSVRVNIGKTGQFV